jgi:hypothetical protein
VSPASPFHLCEGIEWRDGGEGRSGRGGEDEEGKLKSKPAASEGDEASFFSRSLFPSNSSPGP